MNQPNRRWLDDLSEEERESLEDELSKYPASDKPYLLCAACGHARWMHGASEYSHGQSLLDGPCQNPCNHEDAARWIRGEQELPPCDCIGYEPVLPTTMKQLFKQMVQKCGWLGTIGALALFAFALLPVFYLFRLLLRDVLRWLIK